MTGQLAEAPAYFPVSIVVSHYKEFHGHISRSAWP